MKDAYGNVIPDLEAARQAVHICPACEKPWAVCECGAPAQRTLFSPAIESEKEATE
jgi:hypothetical protein